MTKLFSAKLWIVLISCGILGTGIVLACADGWGEEYGNSNFTPEVFVDSTLSPFFYSQQFYYGIGHDDTYNTRFHYNNILDWSNYLNKGLVHDELEYFLFNASIGSLDSASAYLSGKSAAVPLSMQNFKLLKEKKDKKVTAFLDYLHLAKKTEVFAVQVYEYWNYDTTRKKTKPFDARELNRDLQEAFSKAESPFLKERYWFQLERSYFFNNSPQETISLFNAYESKMPRNTIYYRTLAYTAGALYKLKDFSRANYYYSKVYDSCDELKTVAHYSFHPQEEKDWKATLAICRNTAEQATLWQMLGVFYADERRSIHEIYNADHKSDKLDLLLARMVNKYEQQFNESEYAPAPDSAADAKETVHTLISRIAEAGNTGKPWIWDMAAGYINTLGKKYDSAGYFFAKAQKIIPDNAFITGQLRLLKLINTVSESKKIDQQLENKVRADIEWLNSLDSKNALQLRHHYAFEWLKHRFAKQYRLQGEPVKAECFVSKASFYADPKNAEAMKAFLGNPKKTAYEDECAALSTIRLEDIFQYQALQSAYEGKTDEALEKMAKAGPAAEGVLPGNPFNARITDCHDCDHTAVQKIKYTRLSFLKKMKEIGENMAAKKELYNNALLLANAYYNISQYGNARFFYEGKILGEDHSSPFYIDMPFRSMLTSMDRAIQYYRIALDSAKTDEQKAKCQFMIAKCERNQWYNKHVYYKEDDDYGEDKMVDLNALTGFKALKQYGNTNYYKEVIKECGYFRSYIKK